MAAFIAGLVIGVRRGYTRGQLYAAEQHLQFMNHQVSEFNKSIMRSRRAN